MRLGRLWCLLRGHDDTIVITPERLYLACARCTRESPGWGDLRRPDLTERQRHARFWQWATERERPQPRQRPARDRTHLRLVGQ